VRDCKAHRIRAEFLNEQHAADHDFTPLPIIFKCPASTRTMHQLSVDTTKINCQSRTLTFTWEDLGSLCVAGDEGLFPSVNFQVVATNDKEQCRLVDSSLGFASCDKKKFEWTVEGSASSC
jgi:hypothetical protein